MLRYCCLSLSHIWLFAPPWTVACQAPLPMEFPRQEYWSEWSVPCSGDLSNPGNEPSSPVSPVLVGGLFTSEPPWRPVNDILLFSCSVVSYSFQPHGLQNTRLPCPSPSPGACSNSCLLSWSFPASGSLLMVRSLHQVPKVLELQLQHQSRQWIFRTDFL